MLTNYIKLALTVLGRRKFFTFISLFGISLTLVVLMVATAILDNLFAPHKPESRFDRVLGIYILGIYGDQGGFTGAPGYKFLDTYVRGLADAEKTSFFTDVSAVTMYHDGRKLETHLRRTDGAYWEILDFQFLEGGPFTAEDDRNASFVAVITEDMRRKLYGDQPALGKTFQVDGQRFRVVGVVPAVAVTRRVGFSQIWTPLRTLKGDSYRKEMIGPFGAIVLARSTADFPKLRAEFRQRLEHFQFEDPKRFHRVVAGLDTLFEAGARSMIGNQVQRDRTWIFGSILIVAALLFISLPTMNLVSINLSRIMERASEIGVRKAFGASSRALVAQFVVENVVLTVIGGTLGFLLSLVVLEAISRADIVPYAIFTVNLRIFLYGMLVAIVFGIVSGVYPAWRMSRMHPVNALRGGAL